MSLLWNIKSISNTKRYLYSFNYRISSNGNSHLFYENIKLILGYFVLKLLALFIINKTINPTIKPIINSFKIVGIPVINK